MGRHSKNNTAHSIFTYGERKKLKDVGTQKQRLGAESMRSFEHCWLCLHRAESPVCSSDGYIFCRKCIILNMGEQKKTQEEQRRIWNIYQSKKEKETSEEAAREKTKQIQEFVGTEELVTSFSTTAANAADAQSRKRHLPDSQRSRMSRKLEALVEEDKASQRQKNFWIAENAPTSALIAPPEPKTHLVCPITSRPLRLKDLVTLNPELSDDTTEQTTARWICPLSKKVISHQKAVAIRTSGQVVLADCAEKFIVGQRCGPTDTLVTKGDVIPLVSGGTAFSQHNKVEAKRHRPVME